MLTTLLPTQHSTPGQAHPLRPPSTSSTPGTEEVWGRHLVQEAERKRGALRPRVGGGLQQGAGGRGEVGGVCVCVLGVGWGEPSGTLVASERASAITTEMASQSQGIQQLLQAEKRAAEKVADARKRKARRLKQAKEEAQMEVEQYRREREQEFQSKQQAAMGSQGNLSAEVEQATRRQVQGMQSSQQRNRERVLAQLLGMVCDVRPQVHPNYRIAV
ncbi:hypothetical protein GH733_016605 [Mirounga leonina]|nr:hypothetical protein GH733_016605 [Mirounga leonina]